MIITQQILPRFSRLMHDAIWSNQLMRPPATNNHNQSTKEPPWKKKQQSFCWGVLPPWNCLVVFDRFFPTQELDESLSKLESSKGLGGTIALDEKQIKQVVRCLLRFFFDGTCIGAQIQVWLHVVEVVENTRSLLKYWRSRRLHAYWRVTGFAWRVFSGSMEYLGS